MKQYNHTSIKMATPPMSLSGLFFVEAFLRETQTEFGPFFNNIVELHIDFDLLSDLLIDLVELNSHNALIFL